MKLPVREVWGEVFCHESEDLDKVKTSFLTFFPEKDIEIKHLSGMFGTGIKTLRAKIKKKKEINEILEKIFSSLTDLEKKRLLDELELRLDPDGRLFIRLNKYLAFEGKVALADEKDSIQIIIFLEAFPANRENYFKSAHSLIESFINHH